jgi:hypothetical protein
MAVTTEASVVIVVFALAISDVRFAHSELEISRRYNLSVASAKYGCASLNSFAVSCGFAKDTKH